MSGKEPVEDDRHCPRYIGCNSGKKDQVPTLETLTHQIAIIKLTNA